MANTSADPVAANMAAIRAQTDYDGPWHILVQIDGRTPFGPKVFATTEAAVEHAYTLACYAAKDMQFVIVRPGTPTVYAAFSGMGAGPKR